LQAGFPDHLDVENTQGIVGHNVVLNRTTFGTIPAADLENGFYFLQIKGKGYQKTAKFVVR